MEKTFDCFLWKGRKMIENKLENRVLKRIFVNLFETHWKVEHSIFLVLFKIYSKNIVKKIEITKCIEYETTRKVNHKIFNRLIDR